MVLVDKAIMRFHVWLYKVFEQGGKRVQSRPSIEMKRVVLNDYLDIHQAENDCTPRVHPASKDQQRTLVHRPVTA